MATFAVILPAAGKSSRFRDAHYKKPFAPLDNKAVWLHSAEKFLNRNDVKQVIVVISPEDRETFYDRFGSNIAILGIEVVDGGQERSDSIAGALARVKPDISFVAVHDAARPCIAEEWIDAIFEAAVKTGAAMPAVPVAATLKRVDAQHHVIETVPRTGLWEAQTPQVFSRQLLMDAYARRGDAIATDDAMLVERVGHAVTIVSGSPLNIKITSKDDLRLASAILKVLPKPKTFGALHPFSDNDIWR